MDGFRQRLHRCSAKPVFAPICDEVLRKQTGISKLGEELGTGVFGFVGFVKTPFDAEFLFPWHSPIAVERRNTDQKGGGVVPFAPQFEERDAIGEVFKNIAQDDRGEDARGAGGGDVAQYVGQARVKAIFAGTKACFVEIGW